MAQNISAGFKPSTVMGLMSGTSVDGVDVCLAKLDWQNDRLIYEIQATHTIPMPDALRSELLAVMAQKEIHLARFCRLNVAVGELFANAALGLIKRHNIPADTIDCIGSHGQTLYHWPPEMVGQLGSTLQIGEPAIIAEKTGIKVIADFRPRDMAAGGQGAPLVCFADQLLFQHAQEDRCIQNIGGIANVTVVPSQQSTQPTIAFDTGPGNMLMDAAMAHFFGQSYDKNGAMAAQGIVQAELLAHLMTHPYLNQSPPKTTGRELFGVPAFHALLSRFPEIEPKNWLATLNQFTAQSIADAYQRFVFPSYAIKTVIIGGGGAFNPQLLRNLKLAFANQQQSVQLQTHADYGIPDQYKEALAFAILAWAAHCGIANNLPSCTGAQHPVVMGKQVL